MLWIIQIFKFRVLLINWNLIQTLLSQKSKQYKPITAFKMSKDKKLRKIVIDKLFHKNENIMKQSTRSNAPTQSTPNEPKNFSKAIENFFQNFQAECAIIYEPTKLKDSKAIKRALEDELNFLYRNEKRLSFKTQESHILKSSPFFKDSSATPSSRLEYDNRVRFSTQNLNFQSKYKQDKSFQSDGQRQGIFKSKSMFFCTIPSPESYMSKPKFYESENGFSKQSDRIDRTKQVCRKIPPNLLKQDNLYITNSKYVPSKYMSKNAPIKAQEKHQKVDRIKRIQSLKNLNENGVRKYSYKRDL